VSAGDVLQLATCDLQTADEWRYNQSGDFSGFVLGSNEFMACWDTGTGWQGPYKADGQPLRKKPFEAAPPEIGCGWSKLPA